MKWLGVAAVVVLTGAFACKEDVESNPLPTTGSGAAGAGPGGAGGVGGVGGEGPLAPGCLRAPMMMNTSGVFHEEDVMEAPGDRFYGLITAEGDNWLSLYTYDHPAQLDTVTRLWDEGGRELLASSDMHFPPFPGADGVMYHWVSRSRTYCVEAMEFADWAGKTSMTSGVGYRVQVSSPELLWYGTDVIVRDAGDNDSVQTAQSVSFDPVYPEAVIVGTFDAENDRDVYVFPGVANFPYHGVWMGPLGRPTLTMHGYGADGPPTAISLVAPDGVTVLARRSPADQAAACNYDANDCAMLAVNAAGDSHYLVVERDPSRPLTGNDAYSLYLTPAVFHASGVEGPDGGGNDTAASAELMTLTNFLGYPAYRFSGSLVDGDVDWWLMPESDTDERVAVRCGSAFHGSGVEGFTVDAFEATNPAGQPVQSETEGPQHRIAWWPDEPKGTPSMPMLAGGTGYQLKLSATAWSQAVTSRDYFCLVVRFPADL